MARRPSPARARSLATALALGLAACSDEHLPAAPHAAPRLSAAAADSARAPIDAIALEADTVHVVVGRTRALPAAVRDSAGNALAGRVLAWTSSADSVARVDTAGVVTGVAAGTADITVAAEGKSARVVVAVHDAAPRAVAIVPRAMVLVAGDTARLAAAVRDAQDDRADASAVRWASSDTTVARVDSIDGAVEARAVGRAVVVASLGALRDTMPVAVVPGVVALAVVPALDTLEAYDVRQLRAVFTDSAGTAITHGPAIAGRDIRWASSDTAVARVDSLTGALTGVDRGTVTITARSGDLTGTATRVVVIRYRSLTAGSDHACNIASGGIAWCWGRNGRQGMLGLPKLDDKEISTVPVRVPGDHRFVQLTTFGTTTCGLDTEARAWCWGYNGWGALGIGKSTPGQSPTPLAVAGGHRFKSLAAGETQTCGVTLADKVYCWGYNQYYQFGNGTTRGSESPVLSASDSTLVLVSMGSEAGCGLDRRGAALCWGWNGAGQDGGGQRPTNGNTYTRVPTPVVGGLTFRTLSASAGYVCGIDVSDRAHCWGASGMLGSRATANMSTPTPIAGDMKVRAISAGKLHACVITIDDAVWCWGGNRHGQIGTGGANGSAVPVRAAGELTASEVSAANLAYGFAGFTCAISKDRLTTACWGRNDFGQLGNGATLDADVVNNTVTVVVGQQAAPTTEK